MSTLEPKIYIACLAAYNNGYLHGDWVNANQDTQSLYEAALAILKSSPIANAEEWAIHGYEDFGELDLGESISLKTISEIAAFLEEHGELGAAVLNHANQTDVDAGRKMLEESYYGEYDNVIDFVREMAQDIMEIPEHLVPYIDYEAMAYDWFINDYYSLTVNGKVHVFHYY